MPFKHRIRQFFLLAATAAVILGGVMYVAAPPLVERLVVQRVRQEPGLDGFRFDLRHIGFSGLSVANLTTGQSLFVDGIHVRYSLASLLAGRILGIEVSGLDARGEVSSRGVVFADFTSLLTGQKSSGPSTGPILDPAVFSKVPEIVQVKNSVVTLAMDSGFVRIPLELSMALQDRTRLVLQMALFPYGQTVEAAVTAGADTGIETVELKAAGFALAHIQEMVNRVAPGIVLKGRSDLVLSRTGQEDWTMHLSALEVSSPVDLKIRALNCRLTSLSPPGVSGRFFVDHGPVRDLAVGFEGGFGPGQSWRLKADMGGSQARTLSLALNGQSVTVTRPEVTVSLQGKAGVGSVDVSGKIDTCRLTASSLQGLPPGQVSSAAQNSVLNPALQPVSTPVPRATSGTISSITLKARGNFNLQGKQDILEMGFTAASGPVTLETGDYFARIPAVSIPGRLIVDSGFAPRAILTPAFKGAEAGSVSRKFEARDMALTLPVFLPLDHPGRAGDTSGSFAVPALVLDRRNIGYLKGTVEQVAGGFTARARVDVQAMVSDVDVSFGADALATLGVEGGRTRCGLDVNLSRGRAASSKENFEVSGIHAVFGSDDLFAVETRPGQVVTADAVRINDMTLTDVSLGYTLESLESLLVENIGFSWCGGRVTTESMRIQPRKKAYSLTLFCDRLKLSEILRQVGSFEAEGEGTVNGRIPVTLSNGDLSFNRGFLFSSPGQGGKISVRGTEILLAGIPQGSTQYTQVDLAREALKNYQYQWARLLFNTDGETLVVNMAFDGEPENRLPFVYKKEIGGFARVDASSPGSKFQGIRIDVNLVLPLNRVLQFGSRLNRQIQ